jgi:hypothetical protein
MTLRVPKDLKAAWKAKRQDKVAMAYEHASAIVAEGSLEKRAGTGALRSEWRHSSSSRCGKST